MAERGEGRPRASARTAAIPFGLVRAASPGTGDWRQWLRRCAEQEIEQRRLFPWIAVAFGLGILLFFAADGQPALWAPLVGGALATGGAVLARRRLIGAGVAIGMAAVFFGFAAAVVRTRGVGAPVLARTTISPLTGFIESIDEREAGGRLILRVHELAAVPATERPTRVRVSVRDRSGLTAGDFIAGNARLLPPPEAARPGGYDFARDAYFRGIGAVGSLTGRVEVRPPPVAPDLPLRVAAAIDEARNNLTRRMAEAIGGQAGAVAAALVTGKRGLIDEDSNAILRAAGIYHIVSISGLHMVLAAGSMFWLARALLALSPAIALTWPVKKIAALAAIVGATAYCVFSGSEVATERSLVMTLVMFGAILVDRPALTMRNLAVSALIVLAREPEALLGPSFQMSYAAVAALIAAAEWARHGLPRGEANGPLRRAVRWLVMAVLSLLATTVIATLATAPFGTFHFQTVNPLGIIGNALAVPLVSLVVMPCAVMGVLALPFGLDRPIWELMGFAVGQVLTVSRWVSEFSGSTLVVPAFGAEALALMAFALVAGTLMVSPLRIAAIAPALAGMALAASPKRFDLYVDRDGSGAAIRGAGGRLVVVGRVPGFVVDQWLKADGDARRASDQDLREDARCDPLGCVVERPGARTVAVVSDRRAFAEDCRRADLVISPLVAPPTCTPAILLDRRFLAQHGATAVRLTSEGHEIVTTRGPGEGRPWRHPVASGATPRPPPAAAGRPVSPALGDEAADIP